MNSPKLKDLLGRKQALNNELDQLSLTLVRLKTQVEKLNLLPEVTRIAGEIAYVEKEIQQLTKSDPK